MTKDDKIKVSFSVSITRTYNIDEIIDFKENNSLVSDDIKTTLEQMIIIDAIEKINMGGGCFKIIG